MTQTWRLAAASAVGTSHIATGKPCQDSANCALLGPQGDQVLVVAVADGAGSASYSEVGSWLATKTLLECVEVYLEDGGSLASLEREEVLRWLSAVIDAIEATAQAQGHTSRDYACTLLAAIVAHDVAAFIQIGDGAIVVSHGEEDGWSYVFWPQHGEYANTTNFVTSTGASELIQFELAPRQIEELAIFSDGIEKLVLHDATRSVHEAFFKMMLPPVRRSSASGLDAGLSDGLSRYLSSPIVCERTDDDKTLVLASRRIVPVSE